MKRTIRRYKLGYAVCATLCTIGLAALLVVVSKSWPEISSTANPIAAFWDFIWAEPLSSILGVEFKLAYLIILAVATLGAGGMVFAFSRQWFSLPGAAMKLQCSFCKKQWQANYDVGRVLCPFCRHLIHPKLMEE